ncbi:MAG: hypothetical protein IE916_09555, partial [Epsilonproteobacteria bacterium]|nr:hypothetical protein [Campylobacterota bacterium]
MQSIQEQAAANFEANIAYIEANHKSLFEKLLAYESACEKGYYQERYELSFDDGYFEVVDIKENTKLYNMDSSLYASQVSQSINLSKKENLFITFKRPVLDAANPSQKETYPILSYIQSHMPQNERFERVEKFAFFGAGLGVHIASVHEKLRSNAYLIVEDDLELFRLSLFVTPYHKIAKESRLFLSIFEDAKEFAKSAQEFLNFEFYRNHYIKYFEMLGYKGDKLKEFHLRIISQSHNIFFYRS